MGKKYLGVIIKQIGTKSSRDISATSRYMQKLQEDGHETPSDEHGILTGSFNCVAENRKGQLKEIDSYLKLHGNLKSSQAASHQIITYPPGFVPTRKQIERDISILLKKYGMEEHPCVWDAHTDTDNFHIHMLISRVSLTPDAVGTYPIANNGQVKKVCKEEGREDRWRTDWSGCRQSAIAEIGQAYGWGIPDNVRMTSDLKKRPRQTPKDGYSDKTRAQERKSGKKSKQRLIGEYAKKVFDSAAIESAAYNKPFWSIADQDFMKAGIEQVLKIKPQKIHGAYLVGPDGQKCKFSNIGSDYSIHALVKRFGLPSQEDVLKNIQDYIEAPFEYPDEITLQEAQKRLKLIFKQAAATKDWNALLDWLSANEMWLSRSGGGAVIKFNSGKDSIKLSEVSNKFSMKKLESLMGPCPIARSDQDNSENNDPALTAKLKRNGAILLAIAMMKYKHMKNEELSNVRPDNVPEGNPGVDSGRAEDVDITHEKSMFTM